MLINIMGIINTNETEERCRQFIRNKATENETDVTSV